MKIFFRRIHLYLSLAAGLIILIACLTGAILVFEKELMMVFNKSRYYVEADVEKKSIEELSANIKAAYPGAKINGLKAYADEERSFEFNVAFPPKKGEPKSDRPTNFTVFVNPYSGTVLEKYTYRESGFYQVFALHRWLLGKNDGIGKYIVGISTLIFLFIIITGVILWWPKTRRVMMQRLKIKKGAGWKRMVHDLHLVGGFYSAIILFILAFTGLAWSFEWFNKGIYTVTGSSMKPPPPPKSTLTDSAVISFDQAIQTGKQTFPKAQFYSVTAAKDSTESIQVSALNPGAPHESATDAIYLDQYSGKVLKEYPYSSRNLGQRVRSSFKPVHTGSIWGLPSKIVALIACLFGVTLPITGTLMWWNRTRKKKAGAKKGIAVAEETIYE